jgi:signal transduction histidine kinase
MLQHCGTSAERVGSRVCNAPHDSTGLNVVEHKMLTSKFLVYTVPANQVQIRITSGVALALFLVFVVALFERRELVNFGLAYLPFTSAFLILGDWITAALLLAQAKALRTSPLAMLAAGFFFTGLLVVLRVLTAPSFVTPDPTNNTPLFFYLASHAALPLAVVAYTWPGQAGNPPAAASNHPARRYLVGAILLVASLILAATAVETSFPFTPPIFLGSAVVMLLTIAAMVMLGFSLRSELDLWLLLALWGWVLEVALIALDSRGNTLGWYAARGLGLASGLFVLFTMIEETTRLYGQSVQQLEDQDHERERRFLTREAIAASIAHELRQPLAAILLNAQVARKYPEGRSGDMAETLSDIIASGHRANDIIQNTRAMFAGQSSEKHPVDMEPLLRSTLDMVARKTRARKIAVTLVMEGTLKPVRVNAVQIQQVLINLFQNAIEALSRVGGRPRTLEVRCIAGQEKECLTIRVEDNGPGIELDDRKKIFTPFFTTRKHGSGLGLMIASLVLEAHRGRISVEPLSPFGTAFVIRLPYEGGGTG